jgi:hypothetical protein
VHRNGEFLKSDRETLQSDFLNWKPEKKRKKEEEEEEEEQGEEEGKKEQEELVSDKLLNLSMPLFPHL